MGLSTLTCALNFGCLDAATAVALDPSVPLVLLVIGQASPCTFILSLTPQTGPRLSANELGDVPAMKVLSNEGTMDIQQALERHPKTSRWI